jgi:hypothetical protein
VIRYPVFIVFLEKPQEAIRERGTPKLSLSGEGVRQVSERLV